MQREQRHIEEFMAKADQARPDRPTMPDLATRRLRVKLVLEELLELAEAYGLVVLAAPDRIVHKDTVLLEQTDAAPNLRDAYDATLDLLVVTVGTGVAMGTQLEPGWDIVHKTNMAKFNGGYRRADGKWMKPPGWTPPDLQAELDRQTQAAEERDRQLKLG